MVICSKCGTNLSVKASDAERHWQVFLAAITGMCSNTRVLEDIIVGDIPKAAQEIANEAIRQYSVEEP